MATDRRKFLKHLGTSVLLTSASLTSLAAKEEEEVRILRAEKRVSPNDKIRIATIGMGIMGYNDTNAALTVPGVEMVAACDLYKGRLDTPRKYMVKTCSLPWTTARYWIARILTPLLLPPAITGTAR
jgi:hypothetical protein